jgi:hypothetical protein
MFQLLLNVWDNACAQPERVPGVWGNRGACRPNAMTAVIIAILVKIPVIIPANTRPLTQLVKTPEHRYIFSNGQPAVANHTHPSKILLLIVA